jgi:acyl carrier protein
MTNEAMLDRFARILRDLLDDDAIVLTMQTQRHDVPNWDSFNYVNFIVSVELEFAVRFSVADVENFQTVGDIVTQLRSLRG